MTSSFTVPKSSGMYYDAIIVGLFTYSLVVLSYPRCKASFLEIYFTYNCVNCKRILNEKVILQDLYNYSYSGLRVLPFSQRFQKISKPSSNCTCCLFMIWGSWSLEDLFSAAFLSADKVWLMDATTNSKNNHVNLMNSISQVLSVYLLLKAEVWNPAFCPDCC